MVERTNRKLKEKEKSEMKGKVKEEKGRKMKGKEK